MTWNNAPARFTHDMRRALLATGPRCQHVHYDVVRAHHGHHDFASHDLHGVRHWEVVAPLTFEVPKREPLKFRPGLLGAGKVDEGPVCWLSSFLC